MNCETDLCRITFQHVVPILGSIFAMAIFLSPFKAVREVERTGKLGNLNPVPFPMIANNCLVWIMYGLLIPDPYMVLPNYLGILLGWYYTFVGVRVGDQATSRKMQILSLGGMLLIITGAIISFIVFQNDHDTAVKIMGAWCNAILIMFYSAPLTTLFAVIKEKNSVYFYWPLSVSSLLNAALWTVYGLAIDNMFVAVPNAVGGLFSIIQIVCVVIFPRKEPMTPKLEEEYPEKP